MMAPKRQDLTKGRSPRRDPRKKSGINPYIVLVVALVVVAIAATIVLSSGKKEPKAKVQTSEDGSSRPRRVTAKTSSDKSRKAQEREQRKREKRERRAQRSRRERGTRAPRVSTGRGTGQSVSRQLQMIVTGAQGQRLAVIDSRQYRAGDEVEGRRVTEVRPNEVVVEYRGKNYTVRVGQSVLQ